MRDRALWIGVALYAAALFALAILRYDVHRNYVDLGIFAQTAASAFGCFCNTVEGSHWAVHFSPVLYIAGAAIHLWRSALALVLLQCVACALTAPPIYALVRARTSVSTARLAALVVLLYPPLAGLAFNDFHENGFAPAAVAWTVWAFDAGFLGWAAFFAAIALAVKEDQAIFLGATGAFAAWHFRTDARRRNLALAATAASVLVFAAYFGVVQPHAANHAHWTPQRFYDWSAADVRALFPQGLLARAGFLLLAFLPLMFLSFRRRIGMAILVLPLAEVLLSRMPATITTGSHYAGAWAGYAFTGFALGLGAVYARSPVRARRLLFACVALCVIEFAVADPLHPGLTLRRVEARDTRLDEFLSVLPRNISLASQEEVYTHLAATDSRAAVIPDLPSQPFFSTCYVLIDWDFPNSPRLTEPWATRAFTDAQYSGAIDRGRLPNPGKIVFSNVLPRCRIRALEVEAKPSRR
jgi:uncharacterized membrane protein